MSRFCIALFLFGLLPAGQPLSGSPPPNIIVFLADDMGMGDTSVYQDWCGNGDDVQLFTPWENCCDL